MRHEYKCYAVHYLLQFNTAERLVRCRVNFIYRSYIACDILRTRPGASAMLTPPTIFYVALTCVAGLIVVFHVESTPASKEKEVSSSEAGSNASAEENDSPGTRIPVHTSRLICDIFAVLTVLPILV